MLKHQHRDSEAMPTTHYTISIVDRAGPSGTRLKIAGFSLTTITMTTMPRMPCTRSETIAGSLATELSFVNIDITVVGYLTHMVRPAQTARSERTREALRRAALVRFIGQGVEETSAEQIAADAGVSLRTFYRHFASKHDLLFADYDAGLPWFRRALAERPAG